MERLKAMSNDELPSEQSERDKTGKAKTPESKRTVDLYSNRWSMVLDGDE